MRLKSLDDNTLKSLDDNILKRLGCPRRGLACELQCQCRACTELQRVVCSLFSVRSSMARTRGLTVYSEGQWRVVGKAAPRRDRPSGNNAVQKLALKVRWCVCRVVTSICKGERTLMSRMPGQTMSHVEIRDRHVQQCEPVIPYSYLDSLFAVLIQFVID